MSAEAEIETPAGAAPTSGPGAAPARGWHQSPWPFVVAFWLAIGLLESAETVFSFRVRGEPIGWGASLAYNVPGWLAWAALTPGVAAFGRWASGPGSLPAWLRLAAHAPFGALVGTAHLAVTCAQTFYMLPRPRPELTLAAYSWRLFDNYLVFELITYAGVVLASAAWQWYRRFQLEREGALRMALRAAELERSLVEARLSALRMELNPHFLFNALNSVAGLVRRGEGERAIDVLADLGDLLRSTLDGGRRPEVPLGEELALVERYLAIEGVRFADRLAVSFDVAPAARAAAVPSMILQPLVENALRHGVGRSTGPARVLVSAAREGERLRLVVGDSGPGFAGAEAAEDSRPAVDGGGAAGDGRGVPAVDGGGARGGVGAGGPPATPRGTGIGLSNTRSRLRTRYGARAELRVARSPLGGAEVSIRLPFEPAGGGAGP